MQRQSETPGRPAEAGFAAFQRALAQLWMSFGITPDAVSSTGDGHRAAASWADVPQTPDGGAAKPRRDRHRHAHGRVGHDPAHARRAVRTRRVDRLGCRGATRTAPSARAADLPVRASRLLDHATCAAASVARAPHGARACAGHVDLAIASRCAGHHLSRRSSRQGSPVLPYSAFVEMALSATSEIGAAGHTTLKDLALHAPLPLHPHASRTVQTVLSRRSWGPFSLPSITGSTTPAPPRRGRCARVPKFTNRIGATHEIRPDVLRQQ